MGLLSVLGKRARSDPHGQAPLAAFRSEAVIDRQIDELIGLAKGVLADGAISKEEAAFLLGWLETNRAAKELWPANVLYPRLIAALADGHLTSDEEGELLELLLQTVGGNAPGRNEASMSASLPLTKPEPIIVFEGRSFCFTGKFYSGTRAWCEDQVTSRGGALCGITRSLSFLVIGEIGSRDWIHSTHGRKIEKAIDLSTKGATIAIVSERYWYSHLG